MVRWRWAAFPSGENVLLRSQTGSKFSRGTKTDLRACRFSVTKKPAFVKGGLSWLGVVRR
ncbi:hypothetical protein HMPREF3036_01795 [Sutterella sp. KLE1602]|nr:hypothetical protein HMPREF3036_01795 [Sutterella sp. KLE1602]